MIAGVRLILPTPLLFLRTSRLMKWGAQSRRVVIAGSSRGYPSDMISSPILARKVPRGMVERVVKNTLLVQ